MRSPICPTGTSGCRTASPKTKREWLAAATHRFTPFTAATWRFEGFGPNDAALWSEVYCDPMLARRRRSQGYLDPFEMD